MKDMGAVGELCVRICIRLKSIVESLSVFVLWWLLMRVSYYSETCVLNYSVKSSPGYNFQMTQKHLFYRDIKQMQQKVNRTGWWVYVCSLSHFFTTFLKKIFFQNKITEKCKILANRILFCCDLLVKFWYRSHSPQKKKLWSISFYFF